MAETAGSFKNEPAAAASFLYLQEIMYSPVHIIQLSCRLVQAFRALQGSCINYCGLMLLPEWVMENDLHKA